MDGRGRRAESLARRAARRGTRAVAAGGRSGQRLALRWWQGRVAVPPRLGLGLAAGLLVVTGAYGAAAGKRVGPWSDAAAATVGFGIVDLRLSGAVETSEADVAGAVGLQRARSLVGIDAADARRALAALPWVERATVGKELPGTLVVEVEERAAVARWMLGERTFLVDASGAPIVEADGRSLPLVVGKGADAHVTEALALRVAVPAVTPAIKALVRVGERRWDVVTHRNVVVMLPERAPERALARLAKLHAEQQMLDKDVVAIDLRTADRMTVRLTPDAAERRAERLEADRTDRRASRKDREVSL